MEEDIYSDEFLIEKFRLVYDSEMNKYLTSDNKNIIFNIILTGYEYPLPKTIETTTYLDLTDYEHPLPNSIVKTGWLDLMRYKHPLPNSIKNITGYLFLRGYEHALPNNIVKTGDIYAIGYKNKLPESIFNEENINKGFTIIL